MGVFSVNKEVLPIGISLRVPIGTRSDGKLNLIYAQDIGSICVNFKKKS